jgi:hypothetical protein
MNHRLKSGPKISVAKLKTLSGEGRRALLGTATVAQTFLSAGTGDFPVASTLKCGAFLSGVKRATGKSPEPAGLENLRYDPARMVAWWQWQDAPFP